jgi:hypothetical protein
MIKEMCLDKIPVEFDAEGNAILSESETKSTSESLDDVSVSDDDLDPESRFEAVVEELPERAIDGLGETPNENQRTNEPHPESDNLA